MAKRDLEVDLGVLAQRVKSDDDFAEALYGALCNMQWEHHDGSVYTCSWRYAGGLVADLRNVGEVYLDWYCSGNEGIVRDDVRDALAELGWSPLTWEEAEARDRSSEGEPRGEA